MKKWFWTAPSVAALLLAMTPAVMAQPQTKLISNLSKATISAIWCSSLFLEESYFYDEDSEDAVHYEDMAYDLGEELDEVMWDAGLREVESEEVWDIFDEAAYELATADEDEFLNQLERCEESYTAGNMPIR